ncbi:hypothetical protein GP486_005923 [Trichoglossum hirsutum]|uniref:Uncharacterized protein n=1 Tax=Trichoglossum hirsutum TaxID=265104 RepID=A0A9P8L8B9_9PEZI|nr:hypothetical protein GP486_005923 [Trichoglossum hirsutum]
MVKKVFNSRMENHARNIRHIDDTAIETLTLSHGDGSPELAVSIAPYESENPFRDRHIMWRDGDGSYLNAGAFTMVERVDDSILGYHLTELGRLSTNAAESFEVQLANQLHTASRTLFRLPWLVANGRGEHDHMGRKIPPYAVCVEMEARVAQYLKGAEERLFCFLGVSKPIDVLNIYRVALHEMRYGYEQWMNRVNSNVGTDNYDAWNDPCQEDLSIAIRAINKRLEEVEGWLSASGNT